MYFLCEEFHSQNDSPNSINITQQLPLPKTEGVPSQGSIHAKRNGTIRWRAPFLRVLWAWHIALDTAA